jgi:hypothetical protein
MTAERIARVGELRRAISEEMVKVLGLSPSARNRLLLGPLIWPPAHRFASVAAFFDRMVADSGLPEAARWALTQFATRLRVRRRAEVPGEGPLLVASNHPGTVDGLAIDQPPTGGTSRSSPVDYPSCVVCPRWAVT